MKNRMQDLDFEQNVAFDKVQEYEFTRRAAQRFRQVVSLDSFEDEDADVIFHYLYKEMELVSFGDHLKRYIYERAELEEPFSEVPQEVYKEIVVDSFKETYTPKSMNPTSTKLSALVNNWLNQASVKRETVFLLGFGPGGPALSTDISPEASEGSWASSGSNWMFLVDDKPYTGWFTDTDGKQYYMDETGIMQTGWTDIGKKRYYFDMDGILQTGTVIIDKKTYELDTDGSLKDYTPKKKSSKKKSSGKSDTSDKSGTSTAKKSVALTFDDGPSSFTDRLLDCLEENNAKATFFMVGTEIASFPDEVKRMKKLGCELGNHTYDHKDLATLSSDEISSEIARVDEQLVNLTGEGASVVRPPYGSVNDTVKSTVGTPMILWSIDTLDWKTQDVESTVEEVVNNVKDGSIILMHDMFSTSVDAAEILIPQLIEEGYQLVTVHELASLHQTKLSTGVTYGEFNRIK